MVESFGNILIQVDQADYQGDTYVVYGQSLDGPIRYLIFGWGSCSGCDALQACDTYEEVDMLMDNLKGRIRDFASLSALRDYYRLGQWNYEWHIDEFVSKFLPAIGFSEEEIADIKAKDDYM